jgi:putative transposase
MVRMARNLSDPEYGFLRRKRFLIMARDAMFCEEFRATLEQVGIEAVRLPPRSPTLTPHIERFMRSLKDECPHRLIFFGQRPLQAAVAIEEINRKLEITDLTLAQFTLIFGGNGIPYSALDYD